MDGKWRSIVVLLLCQVGAMTVWFSSASVVALIKQTQTLAPLQEALLASAVQIGFVTGTLVSALLSLADRYDPRRLFMTSALAASLATGTLAFLDPAEPLVLLLRFVTGACLAGVYPVGMRLAASWANRDLGLLVGFLVGALTLGSASPHAFSAWIHTDWRTVYGVASACAAAAGVGILGCRVGPNIARSTGIDFSKAMQLWRNPAIRLANLGYLGHMWELYAMWAWLAVFLTASFTAIGMPDAKHNASLLTFAAIAAGAIGAWLGGVLADRCGRTALTIGAMACSAGCALVMGWLFGAAPWLLAVVAVVWGITVIADSAQFSASVAELSEPSTVGTLLTAQTCGGFLLTMVSIHLVPELVKAGGWQLAFGVLAIGPLLGCVAMWRLRKRPESLRIAGGKR
ncbi:MAG: MFS transporter [Microbacteriaceae bacterium]|nr:MFS transporter [Burkholderiaceae bacterium]